MDLTPDNPHVLRYRGRKFSWVNNLPGQTKTIYQLCREAAGLTRAEASDKMKAVSDSKIEKFEYETQEPTPYDIIQMADAYKRPDLQLLLLTQM